jgi:hypothetical protein
MNFEILNINETAVFDNSIVYAEKRTHQPYTSTSFNNNDEIRLAIQQQDAYVLPWYSSLYFEGKVTVFDEEAKVVPNADVRFANNGIVFLFDEVRYEMGGTLVDRTRNPGQASNMKGYPTYNRNQSVALQNAGWFPKENSTIIDKKTGNFNAIVPLRMLIGFCEDYKKIILNSRHELVLIRTNTDTNALILPDTTKTVKVELHKIFWKMPHISVSDAVRLKLIDTITSSRELEIPFRSREFHEYPLLPQTQRHSWPIKTSVERPQYIFFGFQTNRKNQIDKDCSRFDHCNLTNIKVFLNDVQYPYDNLNLNFDNNQFALLYEMFTEFQESFLSKESEPLFTPNEFKDIAPIVIIDCSKQNEALKRSPVDIRLEFETNKNIPDKTTAYCLILHDRIVKYVPIQNVVRVI